jgi:beta-1,4-mannosyl-glycoprotein beta-1,4-N-acetylglucosaminyltransferase
MKIYDCFMFYDEDLIAELRFNILNQYINEFIVVESKYTHSGEKRELLFNINKYPNFKNKINYIVLENEPDNLEKVYDDDTEDKKNSKYIMNALKRENYHRNEISKGLTKASSEDLILISDVDEIPNLSKLDINKINNEIILFKQNFYYYKLNLKLEDMPWYGTKACKFKILKSPQWLRNIKDKKYPFWRVDVLFSNKKYLNIKHIEDGGWHFSNMKTPADIEKKMRTYLHHREYDINPLGKKKIEEIMKSKKSIYNLRADMKTEKFDGTQNLKPTDGSELPDFIKANIKKYSNWIE